MCTQYTYKDVILQTTLSIFTTPDKHHAESAEGSKNIQLTLIMKLMYESFK